MMKSQIIKGNKLGLGGRMSSEHNALGMQLATPTIHRFIYHVLRTCMSCILHTQQSCKSYQCII